MSDLSACIHPFFPSFFSFPWFYINVHKAAFYLLFVGGGVVFFYYYYFILSMFIVVEYTVIHKLLYFIISLLPFLYSHMDWRWKPSGCSYLVNLFLFLASKWLFSKWTLVLYSMIYFFCRINNNNKNMIVKSAKHGSGVFFHFPFHCHHGR